MLRGASGVSAFFVGSRMGVGFDRFSWMEPERPEPPFSLDFLEFEEFLFEPRWVRIKVCEIFRTSELSVSVFLSRWKFGDFDFLDVLEWMDDLELFLRPRRGRSCLGCCVRAVISLRFSSKYAWFFSLGPGDKELPLISRKFFPKSILSSPKSIMSGLSDSKNTDIDVPLSFLELIYTIGNFSGHKNFSSCCVMSSPNPTPHEFLVIFSFKIACPNKS